MFGRLFDQIIRTSLSMLLVIDKSTLFDAITYMIHCMLPGTGCIIFHVTRISGDICRLVAKCSKRHRPPSPLNTGARPTAKQN